MNRIIALDIAKAICIILVVMGHYVPDNSPAWYVLVHDVIYTFHMPLFMFVSGYVYIATKKRSTYGDFLLKKVRRLMVPYLTTSVMVIVIKLLTQGSMSVNNPVTIFSFVEMFYMPVAGYFLWFIWALWWMFVLVPLFRGKQKHVELFVLGIVLHFIPFGLPRVFCLEQFSGMLMYFMFGVFVFENDSLHRFLKEFSWIKVACAVAVFILGEFLYFTNGVGTGGMFLLNAMLPFIGIWFVMEVAKLVCNDWTDVHERHLLMWIAQSSYIIYLFHTTFEGLVKAVLRKLLIDSNVWYVFIPSAILVIFSGVIIPMLLYRFVLKKHRITKLLFGL